MNTPQGTVEAADVAAQRTRIEQSQQAIQDVGNLTPEQEARNVVKPEGVAAQATTMGALVGGGVVGAKFGAGIGTAIAPGPGTAVGAGAGFVFGAIAGAFSKISIQKRQDVKQAYAVFTQAKSNMGWIIDNVNSGALSPNQAAEMWDEQLANFNSAYRNLKLDTQNNLDRFLSGGADELAKIEAFSMRVPALQQELQIAMLTPNTANIKNQLNLDSLDLQ
jgi:uncharacterized protein YcfJ